MTALAAVQTPKPYTGPIFDGDTHIQEENFDFFKKYLPEEYHETWLPLIRHGDEGYGIYIGQTPVMPAMGEFEEDGSCAPPGKLKEWLAALSTGKEIETRFKPTPDFWQCKERIAKLDEWNVDGSILFIGQMVGTLGYLGVMAEEHGIEGANAVLHAYNQYMLDEWGFNKDDRIYATPAIGLWDLDHAIKELNWVVENGARVIVMPMGPANNKAAADPCYDEFWKIVNENEMLVSFHVSEANFMHSVVREFGEQPLQSRRSGQTAWQWMFTYSEIPVMMTMASFIYLNFFERFPKIKMVSVENGCEWLPRFLYKMDKMRGMARNGFWPCGQMKERPSEVFKTPLLCLVAYPEDNIKKVVDEIGSADCIVMGSDYPHAEGSPTPAEFVQEGCIGLTDEQIEAIMHTNGRRMIPRVHS